jgi:hypothetical protein
MAKLLDELKYDLSFVKSHTLQPKWYKILKVFILVGFLVGYYFLSGLTKTAVFLVVFVLLSTLVHMIYRTQTNKWTQSWLDFIVIKEDGKRTNKRIGKYYYSAIVINAVISVIVSQLLA